PHDFQFSTTPSARYLAQADLVICAHPFRRWAKQSADPSAELVLLEGEATRDTTKRWGPRQIAAKLAQCANAGKTAVHILDPDPCLFPSDVEELEALRSEGVPVEVVPGAIAPVEVDPSGDITSTTTDQRLQGSRILLTRPGDQSHDLTIRFLQLGAKVSVQPAIEITPPISWSPVDQAFSHVEHFDWIVFSSVNGVHYLLERIRTLGYDPTCLARSRVAAIGPATAQRLEEQHIPVAVTPPEYRAESLADTLAEHAAGKRFLLIRASRGREVLSQRLQAAGGEVEQVVVYTSRDVETPAPGMALAIRAGQFDWTTVTSSAIARALHALFGHVLAHTRLASISPITSNTLRELGHEPSTEAKQYTTEGLVEAILEQTRVRGKSH
ncbi:MAG: uroporphyrinogen-III synthase, partial [Patescibacteria group bacterium]|nr:uroporphyrinogen-III synthase [Patescibacteria group bacterium]